MKENIELKSSSSAATIGVIIFMELRHACLTSFEYFIILYVFVEWVILLHHCYSFLVRPIWWFILSAQATTTCAAPHETPEFSHHVENGGTKSLGVDIKMIMERLGMFWDDDDKRQVIVSNDIIDLFDEEEPSLDEVKEAFGVFDRNKDGYIDVTELQYALSQMGYLRVSENDCRQMIDRYDVDKDEKISFREFLKLMEDCFQ